MRPVTSPRQRAITVRAHRSKALSGTGRFGFVARTGADIVNAAASSPLRTADIR